MDKAGILARVQKSVHPAEESDNAAFVSVSATEQSPCTHAEMKQREAAATILQKKKQHYRKQEEAV